MIFDHISNRERYYYLGENFKLALDHLASFDKYPEQKCSIPLKGEEVYLKISPLSTKPEADCKFEAHIKYADIHFLAYGTEQIGYSDIGSLLKTSFDPDADMILLSGKGYKLTLTPGYFAIMFPNDAHMPCIAADAPAPIGKIIAKIKL